MAWGETFKHEFYELKIAGLTRKLPKVKINDNLAIASFVMFGDTELVERCAMHLSIHPDFPKAKGDVEILICPEAKEIPLTLSLIHI